MNITRQKAQLVKSALSINVIKRYRKRVVVTGLGIVSPIGCDLLTAWNNLMRGKTGITKLNNPDYNGLPCQVAGVVDDSQLPKSRLFDTPLLTRTSKFALIASAEALTDSGLDLNDSEILKTTGVCVGNTFMEFNDIRQAYKTFTEEGFEKVHPLLIPRNLMHVPCSLISSQYGFLGPVLSPATGFTTGLTSVGQALHYIRYSPQVNVMICGTASPSISPFSIAAYCKMNYLTTKYNDSPESASRPFDKERDGAVLSEGAGILVLESLEHALSRHANIYCEVKGFSMFAYTSSWKKLITNTMRTSLVDANVHPDHVSYVNAHACSSIQEDDAEAKAIQQFFGDRSWELFVSSTKGAHGEILGASGAVELIFTCLAIYFGKIPPTLNFNPKDTDYLLNFVPELDQEYYSRRKIVLKNAISLMGVGASLCVAYINVDDFSFYDYHEAYI